MHPANGDVVLIYIHLHLKQQFIDSFHSHDIIGHHIYHYLKTLIIDQNNIFEISYWFYFTSTISWEASLVMWVHLFCDIKDVWDIRSLLLSRKQNILEKNVSDKSCGVLNDLFSDLISLNLWWRHQGHSNITLNFLNETSYFLLHILIVYLKNTFSKHYNKIIFH